MPWTSRGNGDPRGRRSKQWRDEVARLYDGREPATAAGQAAGAVHRRDSSLPRSAFEDVIDGVAMDLRATRYDDVRRAAPVLSARGVGGRADLRRDLRLPRSADPRLRDRSRHRAAADEHHPRRRDRPRARPRSIIPTRGSCSASAARKTILRAGVGDRQRPARCSRFRSTARAEFYRKAERALPRRDERRLVAARIMGAIYFDLLRAIERGGYDVFRPPRARRATPTGADRRVHLAESDGAVQMRSPDVIVIGAGVAGLRAAVELAARGARVLVLEAKAVLGGRATAFHDPQTGERVDNGQHVMLGCYQRDVRVPAADWHRGSRARSAGPRGRLRRSRGSAKPTAAARVCRRR